MVDISLQIIIAILIGVVNFGFTLYRTLSKGPKLTFPSPYFTVLKNGNKYTLQGLITNVGDQPTIVYLHPTKAESHGEKNFASIIAARDLSTKAHLGSKFTLAPNEFREIDFAIEIEDPNKPDLLVAMIFEYVDKRGKLILDTQEIKFIPETYENYQKFLSLN